MTQVYVCIVETATGKVVTQMGPMHECRADRVERGANRNLNHGTHHTEQRPASGEEE